MLSYHHTMTSVENKDDECKRICSLCEAESEEEREFPFFVSVAYFPDTNYRFEREVDEFKTMEEAKVCFDSVVVELISHNDPLVVTLEKWELGDYGAEVLESWRNEEDDKEVDVNN